MRDGDESRIESYSGKVEYLPFPPNPFVTLNQAGETHTYTHTHRVIADLYNPRDTGTKK